MKSNEDIIKAYHEATDECTKEELKNKLFVVNKKLPWYIAGKYKSPGIPREEFAALATFGMLKAFNTYDPTKDILFATYAARCMHNEILMMLRKQKNLSAETSLDYLIAEDSEGGGLALVNTIESETTQDIERLEQRSTVQALLKEGKRTLNEVEYIILENRLRDEPLTQRELGEKLELSQS